MCTRHTFFLVGVVLLPKLLSLPSSSLVHVGAPAGAEFGAPAAPLAKFGKPPAAVVFGAPVAGRTLSHYVS